MMFKNKDLTFLLGVVIFITAYVGTSKIKYIHDEFWNDFYLAILKFEECKYREALIGDSTFKGFYDIMNDYRAFMNVDIVKLYAGICLVKMKDYDNGLQYLLEVNLPEPLLSAKKYIFIGDCYVNTNKYDEAIKCYQKAITFYDNDTDNVDAMYKMILCYQQINNYSQALKLVNDTINKYPDMLRYKDFIKLKTLLENRRNNS